MAKEVLHDATGWRSVRALVDDDGSWTPPGPGARRGLNRLHGRFRDLGALAPAGSDAEAHFVAEMRCLLDACRALDPAFCARVALDVHDVQFQLCEYDKYRRVADGGRGAVAPYRPVEGAHAFATPDGAPPPGVHCRAPADEWDTPRGRPPADEPQAAGAGQGEA